MSLYNISNRELEDQLASIDKRIAEAKSNEEISKNEAKWLDDIVSLAENQQWKKAMKSARRIMEDQVKH